MTIAASNSPCTAGAMTMSGTPRNAMSAGGAGSKFTTVTSLPSARSAYAIASWLPIESPSGRECEARTNRCRWRMASAISRISGSVAAIVPVDFVDDLVDAVGGRRRFVVLESQLRRALQPEPLADLPAEERRRAFERPLAVLARFLVAQ